MSARAASDGSEIGHCGSIGGPRVGWWLVPLVIGSALLVVLLVGVWFGGAPQGPPGFVAAPYLWPLFPVGFFLIVFTGFLVFRWSFWGGRGWHGDGRWRVLPAREVLRLRYARGEITTEQFRQMSLELDAPTLR